MNAVELLLESLFFLCSIATTSSAGLLPPQPQDRYPDSLLYAAQSSWGSDPDFSYIAVDTPFYHYHVYSTLEGLSPPLFQSSVYAPSHRTYTNPYDQFHIPPRRNYEFPETLPEDSSFPPVTQAAPETPPYYTSKNLFEVAPPPTQRPSIPPFTKHPPYHVYDVPRLAGRPVIIPSNSPNVIRGESQAGKGIQTIQGQKPTSVCDKFNLPPYKPFFPSNVIPSTNPNIIRGEVFTPFSATPPTSTPTFEYTGVTSGVPSVPGGLFSPTSSPTDTVTFLSHPTSAPSPTLPNPVFEAPGHDQPHR